MKSYKDFKRVSIGYGDIAALTVISCEPERGVVPHLLKFGGDSSIYAYIVDEPDVEIGGALQACSSLCFLGLHL